MASNRATSDETSDRLRRAVVQQLRMWQQFGVEQLPRPEPGPTRVLAPVSPALAASPPIPAVTLPSPGTGSPIQSTPEEAIAMPRKSARVGQTDKAQPVKKPRAAPTPVATGVEILSQLPKQSIADRTQQLQILRDEVAACTRCTELANTRTQTVFGVGAVRPRICFFGEAPGADEDRLGEPFVGRAGQLLTKILEACGMRRNEVYILNVLKCRPPGNRNPSADESLACRPFYVRQLEILRPEYICCLGAVAATTLLETNQPIGQLRKSFHDWRGVKVVATYHPAYLLRNPAAKRDVWEDMKMLLADMGMPVPH